MNNWSYTPKPHPYERRYWVTGVQNGQDVLEEQPFCGYCGQEESDHTDMVPPEVQMASMNVERLPGF